MPENYYNKLVSAFDNDIYVKNTNDFNLKVEKIVTDGFKNLHVVSDFDKTITKRFHNGEKHITSFGMFGHCPSVPESYVRNEAELNEKYIPLENDILLSHEEKVKYMQEWWDLSEEILKGLKVPRNEISEVVKELGCSIRDDTTELFTLLNKKEVPILVFSAGLGDIVECILKDKGLYMPNVKVISNYLKYDNEGVILGFKHAPIQVYNKNQSILKDFGYEQFAANRHNVILMGDSIGDSTMSEGIPDVDGSILKIGFLDIEVEDNLEKYMAAFDIVVVNNDTMTVPMNIVNFLL